MKNIFIFTMLLLAIAFQPMFAMAGPEELSEKQMTDLSVDDTISSKEKKSEADKDQNTSKPLPAGVTDLDIIKNPVDNPAELNKAEILRLENQAADQRVNDQLKNTMQGLNPE